jgi:transcriptional regulator with XRE-family HTH domain
MYVTVHGANPYGKAVFGIFWLGRSCSTFPWLAAILLLVNERESFGQVIKVARVKAQKRQADLASALGLHQSTVSDMERGRLMPSIPQIRIIEEALGVPRGELLVAAGLVSEKAMEWGPAPALPSARETAEWTDRAFMEDQALDSRWEALTPQERSRVIGYIDHLLELRGAAQTGEFEPDFD